MFTCALLLIGLKPKHSDIDPFMALGRMRADFGERYYDTETYTYEEFLMWWIPRMGEEPKPDIFFPEGVFGERLFLNGPINGTFWLVLEANESGRNSPVDFVWKQQLSKVPRTEPSPDAGALEAMLARRGLTAKEPVSPAASAVLKAKRGYAGYYIEPFLPTIAFWYVGLDGKETKRIVYEEPWPEYKWSPDDVPVSPFPYPVTESERTALTKQGWKFKRSGGN
jgi:hypothetical protein